MEFTTKLKTKRMNSKYGNELLRRNNSSFSLAVFFLLTNVLLFVLSINKNQIIIGALFFFGSFAMILILTKLKTTIFYDNTIIQVSYWTKKVLWTCPYEDIQRINIRYFSDTLHQSKQIWVILKNGSKKRIFLVHILVEKIAKVFINRNIPIYEEINGKPHLYKPKKYV